MSKSCSRKPEQGVIAIEVALLLPLLLLFFFLIIEISLFFFYWYRLQSASYYSARYAAEHWSEGEGVIDKAINVAVFGVPVSNDNPILPGLDETGNIKFVPSPYNEQGDAGHISVAIEYKYQPVFPINILDFSQMLRAQTVMRIL